MYPTLNSLSKGIQGRGFQSCGFQSYGGARHGEVRRGSRTFEPTLWVQYSLLSYIYYATHIHTYNIWVGMVYLKYLNSYSMPTVVLIIQTNN